MYQKWNKRLSLWGLNIIWGILSIVAVPIAGVFLVYGCYFAIAFFLWLVLICAGFVAAVLIFCANFYMFFVALFLPSLWATMGSMWAWLWGWFSSGHLTLWPHMVTSLPIYFVSGIAVSILYAIIEHLRLKAKSMKNRFAIA